MNAYLEISPRGFANETFIVVGSHAAIATAESIINDDVSAWANRLCSASPKLRAAKRNAEKWGQPIERLSEDHVRPHRPQYIHSDGSRDLGREPLPA